MMSAADAPPPEVEAGDGAGDTGSDDLPPPDYDEADSSAASGSAETGTDDDGPAPPPAKK
jgi:hypothetical protein